MNKKNVLLVLLAVLVIALFMKQGVWVGVPMAVTHVGEVSYPGDTFEHVFTLTNRENVTLPDLDASDGTVVHLYVSTRMLDQAGNVVQGHETVREITETDALTPGSTTTEPISFDIAESTPSGEYAVSAIMFKVTQTWDRATNTWSSDDGVIIDGPEQNSNLAIKFSVETPTPPPTVDPTTFIANLFAAIWNFIKSLFGWL